MVSLCACRGGDESPNEAPAFWEGEKKNSLNDPLAQLVSARRQSGKRFTAFITL